MATEAIVKRPRDQVEAYRSPVLENTLPAAERPSGGRLTRPLVNVILAISVLLALVMSASAALPVLFGLKDMIVVGGSMEPAVSVGDLAMIKPVFPESIQAGDLITFRAPGASGMTTHRVVASKEIEGTTYFQTKGDANATADPNLVPADAVYGKLTLVEPKVGYLLLFGTTFWGKLMMIMLPLSLVLAVEIWDLLWTGKRRRPGQAPEQLGGHPGASMPS